MSGYKACKNHVRNKVFISMEEDLKVANADMLLSLTGLLGSHTCKLSYLWNHLQNMSPDPVFVDYIDTTEK